MADSPRLRVYRQLDPQARPGRGLSAGNRAVVALIVISSLVAVLATEPELTAGRQWLFDGIDYAVAALFLVEYGLRLWIAPVSGRYGHGWRAVGRYAMTPAALLDLAAILPVLLMLASGSTFLLRFARILRLVRLARLGRFSHALDNVIAAVRSRAHELCLSIAVAFVLLLVSSTMVYLCEADHQPETFGSIPRAMWWAIAALTTVGYGDAVPVTTMGRLFAGITAIMGIGLIAMPAGILASAFSDALQRRRHEDESER